MPLSDQDIRALTYLAGRCRPTGAPRWDEAGIFAAIAKVRHMALDDVALSVIRAASDFNAKTPGVIANLRAPNWQERAGADARPYEPTAREDWCEYCGKPRELCQRIAQGPAGDGHQFDSGLPSADPETGELHELPDTNEARALARAELERIKSA